MSRIDCQFCRISYGESPRCSNGECRKEKRKQVVCRLTRQLKRVRESKCPSCGSEDVYLSLNEGGTELKWIICHAVGCKRGTEISELHKECKREKIDIGGIL